MTQVMPFTPPEDEHIVIEDDRIDERFDDRIETNYETIGKSIHLNMV